MTVISAAILANIWSFGQLKPEGDILPVEEAFALHVDLTEGNNLLVSWNVTPGYYLYKHGFKVETTSKAEVVAINLEPGVKKIDAYFGEVEVYEGAIRLEARLKGQIKDATIKISYQGCAENRFCYPPKTRYFELLQGVIVEQKQELLSPPSSKFQLNSASNLKQ